MHLTLPFAAVLLGTVASAQSLSGTVAAGSLHASYGAQGQTTLMSPSPLGASGVASASVGSGPAFAQSRVQWAIENSPTQLLAYLQQSLLIVGNGPAHASVDSADFLLLLQAPSPMQVQIELRRDDYLATGMIVPLLTADVGDDGTLELDSLSPGPQVLSVAIGPVGVPIRVRMQATLDAPGVMNVGASIRVFPSDTQVYEVGLGCGDPGVLVTPHFASAVTLNRWTMGTEPWVPVIGFGIQPVALPGPSPLCVLLPSPDIVLFSPGVTSYTIPIPPALRPLTAYVQSVTVTQAGLVAGTTWQLYAP